MSEPADARPASPAGSEHPLIGETTPNVHQVAQALGYSTREEVEGFLSHRHHLSVWHEYIKDGGIKSEDYGSSNPVGVVKRAIEVFQSFDMDYLVSLSPKTREEKGWGREDHTIRYLVHFVRNMTKADNRMWSARDLSDPKELSKMCEIALMCYRLTTAEHSPEREGISPISIAMREGVEPAKEYFDRKKVATWLAYGFRMSARETENKYDADAEESEKDNEDWEDKYEEDCEMNESVEDEESGKNEKSEESEESERNRGDEENWDEYHEGDEEEIDVDNEDDEDFEAGDSTSEDSEE